MGNEASSPAEVDANASVTGGKKVPQCQPRNLSSFQLSIFNGKGKMPSYVGVNGDIYDVSGDLANDLLKYKDIEVGKNSVNIPQEISDRFKANNKFIFVGKLIETITMTEEELANFTGTKNEKNPTKKIFISAKGMIFDVSSGAGFYGPQGGYHLFAGKNAQRALALTSLKPEDVSNSKLDDLTPDDLKVLDDWVDKYMGKYSHIGYLKN